MPVAGHAVTFLDLSLQAARGFASQPAFWLIGLFTISAIAFSKGAFGGGMASIGVPLLSLIIDPIGAALIIAPLIVIMDMLTLRTFGPSSWSKPDLAVLLPGLIIGLGLGWLLFTSVDPRIVALFIGTISLSFALHWFWKRWRKVLPTPQPVQPAAGILAGTLSGFTTFVAHAGGPPVAIYLIRRGLDKRLFNGTTNAFFTLGNLLKLGPYLMLMIGRPDCAAAAVLLAPVIPIAVWLGLKVHQRLTQDNILLIVNAILILGGGRLIWQAVKGLSG